MDPPAKGWSEHAREALHRLRHLADGNSVEQARLSRLARALKMLGYFPLPNLDLTKCFFYFIAPLSFRNWFEVRALLNFTNVPPFL